MKVIIFCFTLKPDYKVTLCSIDIFGSRGWVSAVETTKPISRPSISSQIDLVIHDVGFFFTLTVLRGACISRTSENSLLKASTFSLGSSKISIKCHGAILRSSINFCCENVLNERRVIKVGGGLGTKSLSSRRIGRWLETED